MKPFFLLLLLSFSFSFAVKATETETHYFNEDFNDNNNGWSIENTDIRYSSINNGIYHVERKSKSGRNFYWVTSKFRQCIAYETEIKIKFISGAENSGYGFIWASTDANNTNIFDITTTGYFMIDYYKRDKYLEAVKWTKTDYLNKIGEYNILKIKKENNIFTYYINGNIVYTTKNIFTVGDKFGFSLSKNMKVEVDYIKQKYTIKSLNLIDNPIQGYVVENLDKKINSTKDDNMPIISPDGKSLYIERDMAERDNDIYVSHLDSNNAWKQNYNVGKPLNNSGYNFVVNISPDNNTIYLGNTYKPDGSIAGSGLSVSNRTKNGWGIPNKIEIKDYKNNNGYINYFMASNNQVLLLAIEDDDSNGDLDLCVSFKQDSFYTKPINMGTVLNTDDSDFGPFLAADNKTLFFASYGHTGYGSSDIFMSKRLDDTWLNWSEPKNLGPEYNSSRWDAYLTLPAKGDYAYMVTSNNSIGGIDIARIKVHPNIKPEPSVLIYGTVYNDKTKETMSEEITYSELSSDKLLGTALSSSIDGQYKIILTAGKNYSFQAKKQNFYPISKSMFLDSLNEYKEIQQDLYLVPIEKNAIIRLNNLFFDYNKSSIQSISHSELNRLINFLKSNENIIIEIAGHTDDKGSKSYNQKLSESRAKSVSDYLLSNGIDNTRYSIKGYGELKPIEKNDTEENRAINRRVEIIIK